MQNNIVDFIINTHGWKQKDLAKKIGVSAAQVSKWKSGDRIPLDREEKLMEISGLSGMLAEWALLVKNKENSDDWISYMTEKNDLAHCESYWEFKEEPNFYFQLLLVRLSEIGFKIPESVNDLAKYNSGIIEDGKEINWFDSVMTNFLQHYNILRNWLDRAFKYHDIIDKFHDECMEISSYAYILPIALSNVDKELLEKIDIDSDIFQRELTNAENMIRKYLKKICFEMQKESIPFPVDYFDCLNLQTDQLADDLMLDKIFDVNCVDDCLSYGEKKILDEVAETNRLLTILINKFDALQENLNK